jgi:hypothetical protein
MICDRVNEYLRAHRPMDDDNDDDDRIDVNWLCAEFIKLLTLASSIFLRESEGFRYTNANVC